MRVAFTQNDEETCQWLSSQLGNQTIAVKHMSKQLNPGFKSNSQSEAMHYISKPLLLPAAIRQLPCNTALIVWQGQPPIWATRLSPA